VSKTPDKRDLELITRLVSRLERLSADSTYAHRASGLRGSLLRYWARLEEGSLLSTSEELQLNHLMASSFEILEQAAREIGAKR
jgi:hypothetical protein